MARGLSRTLLILKPDCLRRRLVGRILARLEDKGLDIVGLKMIRIPRVLALRHYRVHRHKPFFRSLIRYITSGPVVVLVVEGKNAVEVSRRMMGATFGSAAEPGTIRGDFALSDSFNLVHGSDTDRAAREEIRLYFKRSEILPAGLSEAAWIYDCSEGKPV